MGVLALVGFFLAQTITILTFFNLSSQTGLRQPGSEVDAVKFRAVATLKHDINLFIPS